MAGGFVLRLKNGGNLSSSDEQAAGRFIHKGALLMNKFVLAGTSIIALAAGAPAFAQSSSAVLQNGDDLTATVNQQGAGNSSGIGQTRTGIAADVTQDGSSNFSSALQDDDNVDLRDPRAVVLQKGAGNQSSVAQASTGAGLRQVVTDGAVR